MTEPAQQWGHEFGEDYTRRNPQTPEEMQDLYRSRFGVERTMMNEEFLGGIDRSARVLEVGCNIGLQLNLLNRMGFENLYGIEINPYAVETSRVVNRGIPVSIVHGTALDIPFKDVWFDLVYTSGVLIHIRPEDVATVMREMGRCSNRYVWGFEYHTDEGYPEIEYRGRSGMLWKTDFATLFTRTCPEFRSVRERLYPYNEDASLIDQMYLLEK